MKQFKLEIKNLLVIPLTLFSLFLIFNILSFLIKLFR